VAALYLGIKVLDLSAYIAGPDWVHIIGQDQGAQVIKVEPPGGDDLRNYPSTLLSESRAFLGVNRKVDYGVVLDLKQQADKDCLLELVKRG
jgi:crotonobetainyl-CoA:carnitine CoA-transferase CaiB-like acyl-CoA transferase